MNTPMTDLDIRFVLERHDIAMKHFDHLCQNAQACLEDIPRLLAEIKRLKNEVLVVNRL